MYHGRKGVKVRRRRSRPALFGIACRNMSEETSQNGILRCIRSITKYHPNDKIVVVDSDSPDKSYFEKIKEENKNVVVEDVKNKNYDSGAWYHIFEQFPDEETYIFMHDAMILTNSLEEVYPTGGVTIFGPKHGGHSQRVIFQYKTLKELNKARADAGNEEKPDRYVRCVPGDVFMIDGESSRKLKLKDWKEVLPVCRAHSAGDLPHLGEEEDELQFIEAGKPWHNHPVEPSLELWEAAIWHYMFTEARDLFGIKIRYLNQFRKVRRGANRGRSVAEKTYIEKCHWEKGASEACGSINGDSGSGRHWLRD